MMPVEEEEENFDDAAKVVYMQKKKSSPSRRQPKNSESTPSKITLISSDKNPRIKKDKLSKLNTNDTKAKLVTAQP